MRIAIGTQEIAGFGNRLIVGFRNCGIEAELLVSSAHRFVYEEDEHNNVLVRLWQKAGHWRASIHREQTIRKVICILTHQATAFLVLLWAAIRFDAFIFVFGQSFLRLPFDLWLLRLLRKKIVFVFVGSDARPPYIDATVVPVDEPVNYISLAVRARRLSMRMRKIEKYADVIVNTCWTSHFQRRPFIDAVMIGSPTPYVVDSEFTSIPSDKPVRILHCPSNKEVKGTAQIIAMIERLQARGFVIDFKVITGVTNDVVMRMISECDFVVDALYSDTPMSGFAVEAATLGKPAVVGGYNASELQRYYRAEDVPPSLYVLPTEMERAIEKLIVDVAFRRKLGELARKFVRTKWTPELVARRYMRLLVGDVPADWRRNPLEYASFCGYGIPEWWGRNVVRELIHEKGKEGLQLQQRPDLEQAFIEFAGLSKN